MRRLFLMGHEFYERILFAKGHIDLHLPDTRLSRDKLHRAALGYRLCTVPPYGASVAPPELRFSPPLLYLNRAGNLAVTPCRGVFLAG
jgi:hypothetical protein